MPVEVSIPVSLRIAPSVLADGVGAHVHQAVSDAVTRALTEMDREIIAPRSGYAWPDFNAPEFSWNLGDSILDAEVREQIERSVHVGLRDAIKRSPQSASERLRNAPTVIPDHPSEPFDPQRVRGDGYLLESYEGDVPSPDVPVTLERFRSETQWHAGYVPDAWRYFGGRAGLQRPVQDFLAQLPAGKIRVGQTVGVLYVSNGNNGLVMRIAVVSIGSVSPQSVSASITQDFALGWFSQVTADGKDRPITENFQTEALLIKRRSVSGLEDARASMLEFYLDSVGLPRQADDSEKGPAAEYRAHAVAATKNAAVLHRDGYAVTMQWGATPYPGTIPRASFAQRILTVYPMYRVEARRAQGEDSDGGGGTGGAGQRGEGPGGGGDDDSGPSGQGGEDGGGEDGGGEASDGEADGSGGRRGTPLSDPDAEGAPAGGGKFYPTLASGDVVEIDLGPFQGEPSLDDLGDLGDRLRRVMKRIAFRLEMPMGNFAGAFCIAAAKVIGVRAAAVAGYAETTPRTTRAVAAGTGNLGDVDVPESDSPAIRVIQYICGTVPYLTGLREMVVETYNIPRVAAMITGFRANKPVGWSLDFYKEYTPALESSIGYTFIRTCQIKMLELLRSSEVEINTRLDNFDRYYALVRSMLLGLVATEARLEKMRRMLRKAEADAGSFSATVAETYGTWKEARHALTTSLSGQLLNVSSLTSGPEASVGKVVRTPQGLRVRDADGRVWSRDELEQAIAFRHGTAASIDPLIHQFRDIPDVVDAFQNSPHLSRWYLRSLLREMKDNNREIRSQVISDDMFAFRAGKIREDLPNRTIPYTNVALQGIHLMAHEAIGHAFMGDRAYAGGVQYVMDVEQGRQTLMVFAETVSVIALSIICPPAGVALGAAIAVVHYDTASDIEQLYGSLIDPEIILNRADVEFDLFMAQFEIALSLIPEAGSLFRGGATAARTLSKRGLRAGSRSLARRARRELMVSVGRQVKKGLGRAVVQAVLTDRTLALVLPHVLGPLMREIHREISVLSGKPVPPSFLGTSTSEVITENEQQLIQRLEEYQEGDRDENVPPAEGTP